MVDVYMHLLYNAIKIKAKRYCKSEHSNKFCFMKGNVGNKTFGYCAIPIAVVESIAIYLEDKILVR